jgi:Ca2+-binding EF-hand superfamily protein
VLAEVNRKKLSVGRLFQSVDSSGHLDKHEFQAAMKQMGQHLTDFEVDEVMAEIDVDGSGQVDSAEFQDKLHAFGRLRAEQSQRCRQIFDDIDSDDSGALNYGEMKELARRMGFGEQLKQPGFLAAMVAEMDNLSTGDVATSSPGAGNLGSPASPASPARRRRGRASPNLGFDNTGFDSPGDGQISRDEFLAWYLSVGFTYLEKPHFDSNTLVVPTMAERGELFDEFDDDLSGELRHDLSGALLSSRMQSTADLFQRMSHTNAAQSS